MERTVCEIDTEVLAHNIRAFSRWVSSDVLLAPVVKGNAYGHDLILAAQAFIKGGAHWLCVDNLEEARALRRVGVRVPIHTMGHVPLDGLEEASNLQLKLLVYNFETVSKLAELSRRGRLAHRVALHLKLETGKHRQGVSGKSALEIANAIAEVPELVLEGVSSHFASVADTIDHQYARHQLERFDEEVTALRRHGHRPHIRHISNTVATLLWSDQGFEMVRLGSGAYSLWPSKDVQSALYSVNHDCMNLKPALSWKTIVAQTKWVPKGSFVGYGCAYKTVRRTKLAVLPIGYYDGYARNLSNVGFVLIHGQRAPIRGLVCMNITVVDITDMPNVSLNDEVVLLGHQGNDVISAEEMAEWTGTVSYEVVTRIAAHVPRRVKERKN